MRNVEGRTERRRQAWKPAAQAIALSHILHTPNFVSAIGALRQTPSASPSTSRVSEGRMMPSSQSRAVA